MSTDWDERMSSAYADEPYHYGDRDDDESPGPEPQRELPEHVPPRHLLVVGSAQWNQPLIVQAVLLGWVHEHGNPPIVLTVGMGVGAEEDARQFGSAHGWNVISQTDAGILADAERADAVFAFVRDTSDVSSLVSAIAARRAVRVFRDDVEQPTGSWTRR